MYDSTYMFPRLVKFIDRESGVVVFPGAGELGKEELFTGVELQFCKMGKFRR